MDDMKNSTASTFVMDFYEVEGNSDVATTLVAEYAAQTSALTADQPIWCQGSLKQWDDVQRGSIVAEIQLAHAYYMDPRNNEGTLENRRKALDKTIHETFAKFVDARTSEYKSVMCRYRGVDWNQAGRSSWKTLACQPGFQFVPASLKHTENGDWKAGPIWEENETRMRWRTGGHSRNETFAELDAVYANIPGRVLEELNSARAILHDRGIPTAWAGNS